MNKQVAIICCVLLGPILNGCRGRGDLEKVIVSGKVSYDGQPVENGQIYFYPAKGTKGPVSGAPIKDGAYLADAKDGVPVGKHLVKIEGYRSRDASRDDDMLSGAASRGSPVQYIPPKYNRSTELEVTIPGENRKFTQNYELGP
jgi:hypothetical protein